MNRWAGIDEFVAVSQARSFGQAAKRLQRSISLVSREVAALEDRLGRSLLYRTTRHVSLTQAGEHFLARCQHLIEERDEMLSAMTAESTQLRGHLKLTCAAAYGERFIAPVVNQMLAENPPLSVELILNDEVLDLVDRGIDLAIRFGTLRDSRLVAARIASRTRVLCASPGYIAEHGAPANLEDLSLHSCLKGNADSWLFSRDGEPYLHRPHGRLRCDNGYGVLKAALAGLGICNLPDFYVMSHLGCGELVELFPQYRAPDEGVWAIYPNRRHVPTKVKATIERLGQSLQQVARVPRVASSEP